MVKVVIYSHCFAPSVGGVETSVEALARGLTRWKGVHGSPEFEIVVVTNTTAGEFDDRALPFPVVRSPSLLELLGLVRRAHVLHLAGPALLPLLLAKIFQKPTVVESRTELFVRDTSKRAGLVNVFAVSVPNSLRP